jgi:hypothetical protein
MAISFDARRFNPDRERIDGERLYKFVRIMGAKRNSAGRISFRGAARTK